MFGTLFWNLAIKHEFRKGVQFVNDWMSQHCRLCTIGDDKGRSALSDFTRFLVDTQAAGQTCFGLISQTFFAIFQIRPTPDSVELINMYMSTQEEHYHQAPRGVCVCVPRLPDTFNVRYVIAAIDATVWPTDGVLDQVGMMNTILSMGVTHVGHLQLPVLQAQTSMTTVCKNKRKIEDALLTADTDFSQALTLIFAKETVRANSDKRATTQQCLVCVSGRGNKWMESSECLSAGLLGPLPLITVSEMQGYDSETRPGAAARVEQNLGHALQ